MFDGITLRFGVVTTTANEKDDVCTQTTKCERKNPICAVIAALQHASSLLNSQSGIPSEDRELPVFGRNSALSTAQPRQNSHSEFRNFALAGWEPRRGELSREPNRLHYGCTGNGRSGNRAVSDEPEGVVTHRYPGS